MKIAFVVNEFPVLSETFVINQITGLLDRGHHVDVYAISGVKQPPQSAVHESVKTYGLMKRVIYATPAPSTRGRRMLRMLRLAMNGRLHYRKLPRVVLTARRAGYGPFSVLCQGEAFAQSCEYDIIDCQFGPPGLFMCMLRDAGLIKGKVITRFRGYDVSTFIRKNGRDVYRHLFARGDLFAPNCEFFRQIVIGLGAPPERTIIHRSGIDLAQFKFVERRPPEGRQVRICTVSRLTGKKGLQYAVEAVAALRREGLNVRYDIVGDGELRPALEKQIAELGVQDVVRLLGPMLHEQIGGVLEQSHLFMAPSVTSAEGDQDGPVNTLKEAMATGLPGIGTNHGGIPELIEHQRNGLLVPEKDSQALADAARQLIHDPARWTQLAREARRKVAQDFDVDKLNTQLERVYHQLLTNDVASLSSGTGEAEGADDMAVQPSGMR